MTKRDKEQFDRIQAGLKCSAAEAADVLAYDKAVDRGEFTPYDLSPAQNKIAQSFAHTGIRKAPTAYNFTKRERQPNEDKREIIQTLDEVLTDIADDVTVTNPERQIDFIYNNTKYRIVLSAPRK